MSFAPLSFKVGDSLSAYRVVKLNAANQVALWDTVTAVPVGITTDEAPNANANIPVAVAGRAKLYFNDTCAVGALVGINSAGQGIPLVASTAGVWSIGQLVGAAVAATGTIAEVLVKPALIFDVP